MLSALEVMTFYLVRLKYRWRFWIPGGILTFTVGCCNDSKDMRHRN